MLFRDYYYYDVKRKSKMGKKNYCKDDCKVDFYKDDESSEECFDVEVL